MTLTDMKKIAFGQLGLRPKEYYEMTLNEFYLMYTGWSELRRVDLFEGWEQVRNLAYFSLIQPLYKLGQFFKFDKSFPNPYAPKKKEEKGTLISKAEVLERLKRWDKLEYKAKNGR